MYVQVDQQHVNPAGWPTPLPSTACTRLAFVGSSHDAPLQATAGDSFAVMVETQDRLQQRISQVKATALPPLPPCPPSYISKREA